MELQEIGLTLSAVGEIIIAYLVINVHAHVAQEKKIDKDVINTINKERYFGVLAIIMIAVGYIIQVFL